MEKQKYVVICPRCGSTDISFDADEGGVWKKCKTCEWSGNSFPEVFEEDVELFRNELKENLEAYVLKKPLRIDDGKRRLSLYDFLLFLMLNVMIFFLVLGITVMLNFPMHIFLCTLIVLYILIIVYAQRYYYIEKK